jgi:uncharacterized membrane protein YeaQ/YmgE (transglycosylase-associated protein family)
MALDNNQPKGILAGIIGSIISGVIWGILFAIYDNSLKLIVEDYLKLDYEQSSQVGFLVTYIIGLIAALWSIRNWNAINNKQYPKRYYVVAAVTIVVANFIIGVVLFGIFMYMMRDFDIFM